MISNLILQIAAPIPRDLELPLPLNPDELEFILVALFIIHIVFVNLMVGGSVFTLLFEILGRSNAKYDLLAKKIADTVTVNKSLAVVLGVGPLLAINLLYTVYFYSANVLTGYAWISIIPLATMAFLLTYIHKFTWYAWTDRMKPMHIAVGVAATLLFLFIPFIFLANINLMLFPAEWPAVTGFFSSLGIGNVFPRYFHFMAASLAITALFLAGWFGRKRYPVEALLPGFTREGLRRTFYRAAFYITAAQILFGPLVFVTLPYDGITWDLLWIICGGIATALLVLFLLFRECKAPDHRLGRFYLPIWGLLVLVVIFMATGRHVYREESVKDHRQAMADRTETFYAVEVAAHMRLAAGLGLGEALASGPTGKSVFKNCAACHALDKTLAAPSVREVQQIYAGNPDGIVAWAIDPGRKRPEFAPMPSFAHLGDEQLKLVADYMLQMGTESTDTP